MNQDDKVRAAARVLGSRGGKAAKTITEPDRQRRRDWARGLAALRAKNRHNQDLSALLKERVNVRVVVIDSKGRRWPYWAESVQHAVTLARSDGIDAVAGRLEAVNDKEKGKQ